MTVIGVRELRQNASHYLELVEGGETVEVTNHGRPVARLVPIREGNQRTRADLIAEGLLYPGRGNILDVVPVVLPAGSPTASEILDEMRGEG
jgi:prevent-host-death family protein